MRPVYQMLGVSSGAIGQYSDRQHREAAYAAQVTYAPVSELGFDVLRDRFRTDVKQLLVPAPDVVLIDEAHSVLIDEALVPLVLAGSMAEGDADREMAALARSLRSGLHYQVDDGGRNVHLTEAGARAAEQALGGIDLYDAANVAVLTELNVALHAHALLHRDVHYIVRDGGVRLISESRGRVAALQRWPDGLHAAIEAKEGLTASGSGEILDSITIESLVRRYPHRCGMTGTAVAVGEELREFYGLEVAVIEPDRPRIRDDQPDRAGDSERIASLGGLYVIGTGRHASSRLDHQLRGRSGRQGDPGRSVFFVSMEDELTTGHTPDTRPPRPAGADGRVTDVGALRAVQHAQRVAEGARLQIHRNTWRYNQLIEHQWHLVLGNRDRMLRTDAALWSLAGRWPGRYRELSGTTDESVLAEIREGIHLRALGQGPSPWVVGLDPLAEFHAEAVPLYYRMLSQVEEQSAETFRRDVPEDHHHR
jgi:preprotein translocase subunit SecA